MKKKVIIISTVLVVIVVSGIAYLRIRGNQLSPPGTASITSSSGLTVSVTYARPSVRGRVIFGTEAQGALQPYGKYWRLGANESTEITFSRDVDFNGQTVKKGTYRIYAIPQEGSFEIRLNKELGVWGAFEPKKELDVLTTQATATKGQANVEQYTIAMHEVEGNVSVDFAWADVTFSVLVK
jgi:hypothetical protein